jgi:hypothetical protein
MHATISSLVTTPVLWRVLVAAVVIALRIRLDELVPRGHVGRHATSRLVRRRSA